MLQICTFLFLLTSPCFAQTEQEQAFSGIDLDNLKTGHPAMSLAALIRKHPRREIRKKFVWLLKNHRFFLLINDAELHQFSTTNTDPLTNVGAACVYVGNSTQGKILVFEIYQRFIEESSLEEGVKFGAIWHEYQHLTQRLKLGAPYQYPDEVAKIPGEPITLGELDRIWKTEVEAYYAQVLLEEKLGLIAGLEPYSSYKKAGLPGFFDKLGFMYFMRDEYRHLATELKELSRKVYTPDLLYDP